jgi:hypothetical protein
MDDQDRLRRVYEQARLWQFYPNPVGNLKDLLALLAVAQGLKPVAAFGFHDLSTEGFVRDLRDKMVNLGFRTLVTGIIWKHDDRELEGLDESIAAVIRKEDQERHDRNKNMLLWAFSKRDLRENIHDVVKGRAEAGILLGYPACCVDHDNFLSREGNKALFRAIIQKVGSDPASVLKALRGDLKVAVENCAWEADNPVRTDAKFPFLLHIACDSCLNSGESPSGLLNRQLEELAQEVDLGFANTIRQTVQIDSERIRLIQDCENRGLSPKTIEAATKQKLRDLDREIERIYRNFMEQKNQ